MLPHEQHYIYIFSNIAIVNRERFGNRYNVKILVCKFFDKNVDYQCMWNIGEDRELAYLKEF